MEKNKINHPNHYTCHEHECIDEMIALFGVDDTIAFCKLNTWKYRYRAGQKDSAEDDMKKADWYISKAMELQNINRKFFEKIKKTIDEAPNYCSPEKLARLITNSILDDGGRSDDT